MKLNEKIVTLSDDEIFKFLQQNGSLYGRTATMLVVGSGSTTWFIDPSTRVTKMVNGVCSGINNSFVYFIDLPDYDSEFRTIIYENSGSYKTTIPGNLYLIGNYIDAPEQVLSITSDGLPGSVAYTRKNAYLDILVAENDLLVIRDFDTHSPGTTTVIQGNTQFELKNTDGYVVPYRFVRQNTLLDQYSRTLIDVLTQNITNLNSVYDQSDMDHILDAVLIDNELLCYRHDGIYLHNKLFVGDYLKWNLIKEMCLNGYKNIASILSLTGRQLLTLYLDQAC